MHCHLLLSIDTRFRRNSCHKIRCSARRAIWEVSVDFGGVVGRSSGSERLGNDRALSCGFRGSGFRV